MVLHGPRTQTYGETNYLSKSSFGQNQGIAWSSDSNLWENQLLKKDYEFWTNQGIAWSLDSNLWGNQLLKENPNFGQNQGIAWFSDSNLWGNQLLKKDYEFWTELRYCMVLGLKPMGKPTT